MLCSLLGRWEFIVGLLSLPSQLMDMEIKIDRTKLEVLGVIEVSKSMS
jgi:hypothetical protein